MPRPTRLLLYILSLAVLLTIYSCATIDSRISKNSEFFNSLPESHQKTIAQGNIETGFNKQEVFLAWGEPSHKAFTQNTEHSTESWIYSSMQTETYYSRDRYYDSQSQNWVYGRSSHRRYNEYVSREVVFVGDKVDSFTIYPTPVPYR